MDFFGSGFPKPVWFIEGTLQLDDGSLIEFDPWNNITCLLLTSSLFFHPTHFYLNYQFNLLYQFWIHTATIPKLGLVEYSLNTERIIFPVSKSSSNSFVSALSSSWKKSLLHQQKFWRATLCV